MKKLTSLLLAAITMLTLSGCDNGGKNNGSDPISNSGGSSVNTPVNGGNTDDVSKPQGNGGNSQLNVTNPADQESGEPLKQLLETNSFVFRSRKPAICTKDGYYTIKKVFDDVKRAYNLTYIDFASKREVVVCSDSSCRHNTETCTSYFSYKEFFSTHVFVCGDHLYVLSSDYDQDGTSAAGLPQFGEGYEPPAETRRAGIYRMDLDGTNREKIYEAELGDIIEGKIFGEGNDLWFVVKTPAYEIYEPTGGVHYHSKNRKLMRYSASQNRIIETIPLDDYKNIELTITGCTGGKLILEGTAYPNGTSYMDNAHILIPSPNFGDVNAGWEEFREQCEVVVFTLDLNSKEYKEVYRMKNKDADDIYWSLYDEWMYFKRADYTVYKKSVLTGETVEVNVPSGYRHDGFFLDKMAYRRVTDDWSDDATYLTDLDGSNLTKSPHSLTGIGGQFSVLGVSEDKAVVQYGTEKEERPEGGYEIKRVFIGIMTLDDLYNGIDNIEPVTLVND